MSAGKAFAEDEEKKAANQPAKLDTTFGQVAGAQPQQMQQMPSMQPQMIQPYPSLSGLLKI